MKQMSLFLKLYLLVLFVISASFIYGAHNNFSNFNRHFSLDIKASCALAIALFLPVLYQSVVIKKNSILTTIALSIGALALLFGLSFASINMGFPSIYTRIFGIKDNMSFLITSKSSGQHQRGCRYYLEYAGNGIYEPHHCVNEGVWINAAQGKMFQATVWKSDQGILVPDITAIEG